MPNMSLKKNPMPTQEPEIRARNFNEVALGYTPQQAMDEAARCLNCRHKPCIGGCPVAIDIPAFIQKIKSGEFEEAYQIFDAVLFPARCLRSCLPAGDAVRKQMRSRREGRTCRHRPSGALCR